jgi:hypothetical protein
MQNDKLDRRHDLRVDFDTEVFVKATGVESRYKGSSRDLSMRSLFIKTDKNLDVGTPCSVEIVLTGLQSELILKMEGHVVRNTDEGYAIYFDSVDLDSYTHLRNIVRYNSPDPEGV